jgi:2-dehydropantoate 2-reductase
MRICVVGVGGVGGYFGGKLTDAFQDRPESDTQIYFVARGDHLSAIKRNGLVLKTSDDEELKCYPRMATDDFGALPEVSVFIVAVKGYDLDEVSRELSHWVKKETVILPLLNGVDIRERMQKYITTAIILPACVYISSFIEGFGIVGQSGSPGRMIIGSDPDTGYSPDDLVKVIHKASIPCDFRKDAYPAIWEKYIFIASYGLVSARFNKTLGEIYEDDPLRSLVRKIMEEILKIATVQRVSLSEGIVDASLRKAQLFPRDTRTSLQRDIHQGKGKSELDLFGGTIVHQGIHFHIPTPVTKQIYKELLQK